MLIGFVWPALRGVAGTTPALMMAAAATLFVPGWLILQRWGRPDGAWDVLPLSFAVSLVAVAALTVLAFEAHLSSHAGALILVSASGALALLGVFRPRREWPAETEAGDSPPSPSPPAMRVLRATVLVGLAAMMWAFLTVGGTRNPRSIADLQEEALHLSIIRKVAENDALSHSNVMYKAGAVNTYVYPPYHFALALISHLSGLDPIVVYLGLRPVFALVALLTMRSLAAKLFTNPWVPDLSLLLWLILVFTNVAGQVPRYFWAQLVPLSHLGDFGLGVVYPLLLLCTFRFLLGRPGASSRVLTPALLAAALLVHTREVLQILVFLGAAAAYALVAGDRVWRRRLFALVAIVLVLGLLYKVRHGELATHAVLFEAANREAFRRQFEGVLQQPFWTVVTRPNPVQYRLNSRAVFLLPLAALPLLWWIRHPWSSFAAPGLLAMALVTRIPYLTFPFILVTYSEMLKTPARYFVHWGYLMLGAAFATGVVVLARYHDAWSQKSDRRMRLLLAGAAGGAGFLYGTLLGLSLWGLESVARGPVDAFYVFAGLGSLASIGFLAARGRLKMRTPSAPSTPGWATLLVAIAAAIPLTRFTSPPALWEQYTEWRRLPSTSNFWEWYGASDYGSRLPGAVVRFLRDEVPAGRVIAAPNRFAYAIPVLANEYIVSWGYYLSTELDIVEPYERVKGVHRDFPSDPVESYLKRAAYATEVIESEPLFDPRLSPDETLAHLREYGVEYVVSGPLQRPQYEALAAAHPDVLQRLYARRDYGVFRVNRERLPTGAQGSPRGPDAETPASPGPGGPGPTGRRSRTSESRSR